MIPTGFVAVVKNAIQRDPKHKATGSDEIFNEAMHIAPGQYAELLTAVWYQSSKLGGMPSDWQTSVMVPLYRKVDEANLVNYRPIVLMCHDRKVVESAIAKTDPHVLHL